MIKYLLKSLDGSTTMVNDGIQVDFVTTEELLFYTGLDLTGEYAITYEPLRDIHVMFDGEDDEVLEIPNIPYEAVLNNLPLMAARKEDPYYNLSGQDLIDMEEEVFAVALEIKLFDLDAEYKLRVEGAMGILTEQDLNKDRSKQMKLIRKEAKGNATQADLDYLDEKDILDETLDSLDSKNDSAEAYLEDPIRTLGEVQDYDVVNDPNWEG